MGSLKLEFIFTFDCPIESILISLEFGSREILLRSYSFWFKSDFAAIFEWASGRDIERARDF